MRSTILPIWMLLCVHHQIMASPSKPHNAAPNEAELPGSWGYCGSRYGLEPADAMGAIECACGAAEGAGETISVGRHDKPRLLCDRDGARVWISPFLNKPELPAQDAFVFDTTDVLNFTIQVALKCCHPADAPTCSSWGLLSEVPGRHDVLISINHSDAPEAVSCNDVGC